LALLLHLVPMKRYTSYFQAPLPNAIPEASEVEIMSGEYFANDTFDVGIYVIYLKQCFHYE